MMEVYLSIGLAIVVIGVIIAFYNDLFFMTFDEETAKVSGIRVDFLNSLLIVLTAVTIVSSMRVIGLLLASSLIILPAASALQLSRSFKGTLVISALISVLSVIFGLFVSYYFDFATSGTIVLINAVIFLLCYLVSGFNR